MKKKTILIQSINGDLSTNEVLEWIVSLGYKYKRSNEFDLLKSEFTFNINQYSSSYFYKHKYSFDKVLWYRKGGKKDKKNGFVNSNEFMKEINLYESAEKRTLKDYYYKMMNKKGLNVPPANKVNKLIVLQKAGSIGLNIPQTIVTNNKKEIVRFINKYKNVVTKSISDFSIMYEKKRKVFVSYTSKINLNDLKKYPKLLFPILIQQEIKKKFDIRVFYLGGKCYPMAIFSQNDEQTSLDFRRYNFQKPNRQVPYKLTASLKSKIDKLMKYFNLESGSLDFVLSKNDFIYFLEVNPVGQFGMVSYPCNYNLEKKIAQYLIKKARG